MAPQASVASSILSSLEEVSPEGATPTDPAIAGALEYANSWGADHSQHKVAVVLVTDGLPTECGSTDIDSIAERARAEAPDILTFVIGVFEAELAQTAQTNLDALAKAGGTETALIVSTSSSVAQEIGLALASVRESAIACEYEIPEPTSGPLDYDFVNVEFTRGGVGQEPTLLPYVESASGCNTVTAGWYYDRVPSQGAPPSLIRLCPQTCAFLQGDESATVRILLGCRTVLR